MLLFFIAKWFGDSWIVKQFLKYGIYNSLADLRTDLMESLPASIGACFSNNIYIKIAANPLFNDFGDNSIVFLLFSNLRGGSRLSLKVIY